MEDRLEAFLADEVGFLRSGKHVNLFMGRNLFEQGDFVEILGSAQDSIEVQARCVV